MNLQLKDPMSYQTVYVIVFHSLFWISVHSFSQKPFEIWDLESHNEIIFADEVSKWKAQNNLTEKLFTTCGNTLLLGGVGVLDNYSSLKRTYNDLPNHEGIMGEITFWFIDDWEEKDTLYFSLASESQQFYNDRILGITYNSGWSGSTCGNPSIKDLTEIKYYFVSHHTGKNLTLQIINKLVSGQDRVYYGIRDIKVLLVSSMAARSILSCGVSNFITAVYKCNCLTKNYFDGSTCHTCDPTCDHCSGSGPTNCIVCPGNRYFDGTNCNACHSSCGSCSGSNENECLSCISGRYLYKNSSCLPHCDPPFTIGVLNDVSYCNFPCNSSLYINYNGSCTQSCSLPFKERTFGDNKFCMIDCTSNTYAYPNGSCLSYCDAPMRIFKYLNNFYCLNPCEDSDFYYPNEKECSSSCLYPFISKINSSYSICEVANIESMALLDGNFRDIINKCMSLISLGLLGHSWGIIVTVLARLLQNIRYLNISYESYSYTFLRSLDSSIPNFAFMAKMPQEINKKIPQDKIPFTFEIYGVHSSFLVNFWQTLISIGAILSACLAFKILEHFFQNLSQRFLRVQKIVRFLRVLTQNALLTLLYGNYGEAILYSVIEFKSENFGTTLGIIGFGLSIFFIILIFVSFIGHFWFLIERQKLISHLERTDNENNLEAFSLLYAGFKVLVQDFKYQSQKFILIFFIRDILANISIALLLEYQFYQTIILSVLSFSMTLYVLSKKPFKSTLDNFQQIFWEVLLLLSNIAASTVTVLNETNSKELVIKEYSGQVIVMIYNIFFVSVIVSFILKLFTVIYTIVGSMQKKRTDRSEVELHIRKKRNHLESNIESSVMQFEISDQFDFGMTDPKGFNFENTIDKDTWTKGSTKSNKRQQKKANQHVIPLKYQLRTEFPVENKKVRIHVGKLRRDIFSKPDNKRHSKKKELEPTQTTFGAKFKAKMESEPSQTDFFWEHKNPLVVDLTCKEKDIKPIMGLKEVEEGLNRRSSLNVPRRFVFKLDKN